MDNKSELRIKSDPPRIYSENFKRLVVEEYERGFLNKGQLQRKYDIRGNSCISRWLKKYGNFTYVAHLTKGRPMKNPDKQRIKELEETLRQSQLDVELMKKFINIAERELNIKIVKKSGTKPSGNLHDKNQKPQ